MSAITHMAPGQSYRVVRPFTDFDGRVHAVGDIWQFRGESFLPYDDGLSLFVTINGKDEQVRMRLDPEDQGRIVDWFADYLEETMPA
ncbi:MAG: DUF3601 domain-containing protein [Hyphomicrobiales bacterium]|nr:MAG: DUF3601 domain-containing protein [Hyphomicrobiales bacterium]